MAHYATCAVRYNLEKSRKISRLFVMFPRTVGLWLEDL